MPLVTFTAATAVSPADLQTNFAEALANYNTMTDYGVTGRVHTSFVGDQRHGSGLASPLEFVWTQNGLADLNPAGLGALINAGGASFTLGAIKIVLTCDTDSRALGPDPEISWSWASGGAGVLHEHKAKDATAVGTPNLLLPGFTYRLTVTFTGGVGTADWMEFGVIMQRYPKRTGGL